MQNKAANCLQALACWNWKCALLSATMRSSVYLAAMARSGHRERFAAVLVEIAYVSLTAGLWAGLQQRALGIRRRWLGNLAIVVAVPALAQFFDWTAHRLAGPVPPPRALLAVCAFTLLSALFHLHVMRRGVFLTGTQGRSLVHDFRAIPRMIAGFLMRPAAWVAAWQARLAQSEPA